MSSAALDHPAVAATLDAVAEATGMRAAFVGVLDSETFAVARVGGGPEASQWLGPTTGIPRPRTDSFCHHMLLGAGATSDAASDSTYGPLPVRTGFGITSYVGSPLWGCDGSVLGTLCAVDFTSVPVDEPVPSTVARFAQVLAAVLDPGDESPVQIVRTPTGWAVRDARSLLDDPTGLIAAENGGLVNAMVLADLLAPHAAEPGRRVPPGTELDEATRLRTVVSQLEYALASRVVVERAIGVLMERQERDARDSFDTLRRTARTSGIRVHDLASAVVDSATDDDITLPESLH